MSGTVCQLKMPNSEVYIEVRRDKGLSLNHENRKCCDYLWHWMSAKTQH